jgi:hypothetical protein
MKFSIGDKIIVKRTGEEGCVTSFINQQMLEVEVNGTRFPVHIDEVDHPYLTWFTQKKKPVQRAEPEQLPMEKQQLRKQRLAKGVYLSFIPVFKPDDFEDVVDYLKVYLLNELPQPVRYVYEVRNQQHIALFKHEGKLHEFGHVYLHNIAFEDMNDQPKFNWTLESTSDNNFAKAEDVLRIKPFKIFSHINEMLKNNEPSFSYLLIDEFKEGKLKDDFFPEAPIVPKTKTRSSGRIEIPRYEVDLHIENIVESTKGMTNADMLQVQLDTLKYYLALAIKHKQERMIVIHGLGKGVLREEVHKVLKQTPEVSNFTNEWQARYGFGATEVHFEKTI